MSAAWEPAVRAALTLLEFALGRLLPNEQRAAYRHIERVAAERAATIGGNIRHAERLRGKR